MAKVEADYGFAKLSESEASQRLALILKAGNNIEQVQYPEGFQHVATGTEQFQVATLTSERNADPNDAAKTGTVDLRQVFQVQQQLAHTTGDQLL